VTDTCPRCLLPVLPVSHRGATALLEPDPSPLGVWTVHNGHARTLTNLEVLKGARGHRTHICPPLEQGELFGENA
jgi:hypothetical protein